MCYSQSESPPHVENYILYLFLSIRQNQRRALRRSHERVRE
jgi:hypothetical protein